MLRDSILYYLFLLGRNKYIGHLFKSYYAFGVFVTKLYVSKLSFIDSMYLKGSYNESYFIPVISDLDFYIIGIQDESNLNIIQKRFKILNLFFPFISDFDFISTEQSDYLRNFSGLKFLTSYKWKCIKGTPIGFSYRYYPRKFYIDIVHEIYFQIVWLNNNLKLRNKQTRYRTICIYRQYLKVCDLINFLENYKGYEYTRTKLDLNTSWNEKSNEEIIKIFDDALKGNEILEKIKDLYKEELKGVIRLDEIIEEAYFKKQLVFIENDFKFCEKLHFYSQNVFELFYLTGCIDSYLISKHSEVSNDEIGKLFSKGMYFAKIIEGRFNYIDGKEKFIDDIHHAYEIKKQILSLFPEIFTEIPRSCINKNIYLFQCSSLEKVSTLTEFLAMKKMNEDEENIVVYLGESLGLKQSNTTYLHINQPYHIHQLDQKVAFMKKGIDWSFLARTISISHNNLSYEFHNDFISTEVSNDVDIVLLKENNRTLQTDIQNIIWSTSYKKWMRIGFIINFQFSKYFNHIMLYKLLGKLPESFPIQRFTKKIKKNYHISYNISILKTELIKTIKEDSSFDQESRYCNNFLFLLSDKSLKNESGFFIVSDDRLLAEYNYFLNSMESLDIYGALEKYEEYYNEFGFIFNNEIQLFENYLPQFQINEYHSLGIIETSNSFELVMHKQRKMSEIQLLKLFETKNDHPGQYYIFFETDIINISSLKLTAESSLTHICEEYFWINDSTFVVPIYLSLKDKIKLEITIELSIENTYKLELIKLDNIDFSNSVFGLDTNIIYDQFKNKVNLGLTSKGLYRLTIYLDKTDELAGFLVSNNEIKWPISYSGASKEHIFFFEIFDNTIEYEFRFLQDNVLITKAIFSQANYRLYEFAKFNSITLSPVKYYENLTIVKDILSKCITLDFISLDYISKAITVKPSLSEIRTENQKKIICISSKYDIFILSNKNGFDLRNPNRNKDVNIKLFHSINVEVANTGMYLAKFYIRNLNLMNLDIEVSSSKFHKSNYFHKENNMLTVPVYLGKDDTIKIIAEFYLEFPNSSLILMNVDKFEVNILKPDYIRIPTSILSNEIEITKLDIGLYFLEISFISQSELNGEFVMPDGRIYWPRNYKHKDNMHIFEFCILDSQTNLTFISDLDPLNVLDIKLLRQKVFSTDFNLNQILFTPNISSNTALHGAITSRLENEMLIIEEFNKKEKIYYLVFKSNEVDKCNTLINAHVEPCYVNYFGSSATIFTQQRINRVPIRMHTGDTKIGLKFSFSRLLTQSKKYSFYFEELIERDISKFFYKKYFQTASNNIDLGFLPCGRGKIELHFKKEVELKSYFCSSDKIVWPIEYKAINDIHNLYFEVGIGYKKIYLEDLHNIFDDLDYITLNFEISRDAIAILDSLNYERNQNILTRKLESLTLTSFLEAGYYEYTISDVEDIELLSIYSSKDFKCFDIDHFKKEQIELKGWFYLSENTQELVIDYVSILNRKLLLKNECFKKFNFYNFEYDNYLTLSGDSLEVYRNMFIIFNKVKTGVFKVVVKLNAIKAFDVTILSDFKEICSTIYLAESLEHTFFFRIDNDTELLHFKLNQVIIHQINEIQILKATI